jgi:hypothetical protein
MRLASNRSSSTRRHAARLDHHKSKGLGVLSGSASETTLHGRVHPHDVKALFDDYPDVPLVSISNDQRSPMHQADRVSVPPQMLVVLFDRFANVTQAIRRDDERQIALFHLKPPSDERKGRRPRMA